MGSPEYEKLLEKNGYLRCKVDVSDILMQRQRELHAQMDALKKEIDALDVSIEKQKKINEFLILSGEANSLYWVNRALGSCVPRARA